MNERALVFAPTSRDAQVTKRLMQAAGVEAVVCGSVPALLTAFEAGVDLLVTTDELTTRKDLLEALRAQLHEQPGWSELPIIIVAREERATLDILRGIPGALLLERPVQIRTFVSTVQAALAARRRQYQIRDQLEQIRVANDELERTALFAQQLMAIVSHDLRNPLSAIQNGSQLLLRSDDPAVQRIAPMLKRSAERANGLINDLLDFSQARMGGGIPRNARPMSVNELLDDVAATMSRSDPDRRIELQHCSRPDVEWDYERLHQALVNLLVNAFKHSPKDSAVAFSSTDSPTEVSIEVTNRNRTGQIPAEIRGTLFEPFKRFAVQGAEARGSVGLGLYIVDQIVRAHGGLAACDSEPNSTTFRLTLPRQVPNPPAVEALTAGGN